VLAPWCPPDPVSAATEATASPVTFHRQARQMRDRASELMDVPGIGARTTQRLVQHFGSGEAVKEADATACLPW